MRAPALVYVHCPGCEAPLEDWGTPLEPGALVPCFACDVLLVVTPEGVVELVLDVEPEIRRLLNPAVAPEEGAPEMGMWEPFERGEPLTTLEEVGQFVLLKVKVREGIATEYGTRDVADLTVATTDAGVVRTFGSFAAGIVGQAKRIEEGDLPAVVFIEPKDTQKGATKALTLLQLLGDKEPHKVAAGLKSPIAPLPVDAADPIPY